MTLTVCLRGRPETRCDFRVIKTYSAPGAMTLTLSLEQDEPRQGSTTVATVLLAHDEERIASRAL